MKEVRGCLVTNLLTGDIPVPKELGFGNSYTLVSREDFTGASVAFVTMNKSEKPHYHAQTTEFYYVVRGTGAIKLDGEKIGICTGELIMIPPHIIHCAVPTRDRKHFARLEILIISVPATMYTVFIDDIKKYGFK